MEKTNENYKLLFIYIFASLAYKLLTYFVDLILILKKVNITETISSLVLYVDFFLALILIAFVGLNYLKDFKKDQLMKVSFIFSIYIGIIVILNILSLRKFSLGLGNIFFLPVDIFRGIYIFLLELVPVSQVLAHIIFIISPFIFTVFSRENLDR